VARWRPESVVPAVFAAADQAIAMLMTVATFTPGSPICRKKKTEDLAFAESRVFMKAADPSKGMHFSDLLRAANLGPGQWEWQKARRNLRQSQTKALDAFVSVVTSSR